MRHLPCLKTFIVCAALIALLLLGYVCRTYSIESNGFDSTEELTEAIKRAYQNNDCDQFVRAIYPKGLTLDSKEAHKAMLRMSGSGEHMLVSVRLEKVTPPFREWTDFAGVSYQCNLPVSYWLIIEHIGVSVASSIQPKGTMRLPLGQNKKLKWFVVHGVPIR